MTYTKNRTTVITTIAVFVISTVLGSNQAFATHVNGVEDYEWHIWSRNTGDDHTGFLNCSEDDCDLKIKTISGIQSHSQSTINGEVDTIETDFDNLGKNMSIDRVTTADSVITEKNLGTTIAGQALYDMHCTNFWLICWAYDSHFIKMTVNVNDNSNEFDFKLAEDEGNDEYDVRKTLGHELFHAMGIDHNSESDSIVYYQYIFGSTNGYEATTTDETDLGNRYP